MQFNHSFFIEFLLSLPRYLKQLSVLILDICLCFFCTWFAFYLRLGEFNTLNHIPISVLFISIILALPIFWLLGLYRTIFRYSDLYLISATVKSIIIYGFLFFTVTNLYGLKGVPRSIGLIQPFLLFFSIVSSRLLIKFYLFIDHNTKKEIKKKVLVYGAGKAGRQLVSSLENNTELKIVGFLDDNIALKGKVMMGKKIFLPSKLDHLIKSKNIDLILLALPSISRNKRNQIIKNLGNYKLLVKTLPRIEDIVDGKISVSDIKDLDVDDLLNREPVKPNSELLFKNIKNKNVLVTGAGGSIGSELSRQIVKLKPNKLILLELNEFVLYKIYEELKNINSAEVEIVPLINNVQNETKLNKILKIFKVETVYHAAAYKHVSLVEENVCEGIKNNVFGTLSATRASINNQVKNFVLISSDKAVRPTNIMGASKRLAEICLQSLSNYTKKNITKFSIVRFGNVLESSGSVIPKFKKQIKNGGPVTLTHFNVTRYFMTLIEAAQLVIQAGAMSKKCEVFVLDMGESIKIRDLIYKMINLSGLTIKDSKNLEGDIEIKEIGLRPGEKLYEELLIGENPKNTEHPKIYKAEDPFIEFEKLEKDLKILIDLLDDHNVAEIKKILKKLVPSYVVTSMIVDTIYLKEKAFYQKID